MSLNSINPPMPGASSSTDENDKSLGHRLLRLVRSSEKGDSERQHELSLLLRELYEIYSRKGLLQGDTDKANKLLPAVKALGVSRAAGRRGKQGGDRKVPPSDINLNGDDVLGAADDVNLLLSALVRLTGGNQELSSPLTSYNFPLHLVVSGVNVCIAALQHIIGGEMSETCSLVEYDLFLSHARALLTGVSRTIRGQLDADTRTPRSEIVVNGFQLSVLIISLYGTKLSRNQTIFSSLELMAWEVIPHPGHSIQRASSQFLASLPQTAMNKQTPSDLWTQSFFDSVSAFRLLLGAVVPLKSKASEALDSEKATSHISPSLKGKLDTWIDRLRKCDDQESRTDMFFSYMSALTSILVALLRCEVLAGQPKTVMSTSQLPILEILGLLDTLMTFPSYAESIFYGTKRRLRFEIIENGLLSPHMIVSPCANKIKMCGMKVFNIFLQCVGKPVLLPFGRHIVKMAYMSLMSSCSPVVRQVLEPTYTIKADGKRERWLHNSAKMRACAIKALGNALVAVGSNSIVLPSETARARSRSKQSPVDKSIALIAGCLLEQVCFSEGKGESWGTTLEMSSLVVAAIQALSSSLIVGGGFLPQSSRSLIDSTIRSCLWNFGKKPNRLLFATPEVKLALVHLMSSTVVTPWQDGSTTSLVNDILLVGEALSADVDEQVAGKANLCIQLIQSMRTTRVPPLTVVARSVPLSTSEQELVNASSIIKRIHAIRESTPASENKKNGFESPRKSEKRVRQDDTNQSESKRSKPLNSIVENGMVNSASVTLARANVAQVSRGEVEFMDIGGTRTTEDERFKEADRDTSKYSKFEDDEDLNDFPGIVDVGPDEDDNE